VSSTHERFWDHSSFAFVGSTGTKGFPKLSYRAAKDRGKKVFAVDSTVEEIEGEPTFPDFKALPEPVDAAVLELPKEDTADWVGRAADAGIHDVWIHMNRDTPEALAVAEDRRVTLHTGTCAVMYLTNGVNVHGLHRWIEKLRGRY
jgi:predicted CoA-binding protein